MLTKEIKKLLTPEELVKVVDLEKELEPLYEKLRTAREVVRVFPDRIDKLQKREHVVLARAYKECERLRQVAISKGKCPRWIRTPKREDGQEYKCPTGCPFFVKEETGEYVEVAGWGCGEYEMPVYRYYCKREEVRK